MSTLKEMLDIYKNCDHDCAICPNCDYPSYRCKLDTYNIERQEKLDETLANKCIEVKQPDTFVVNTNSIKLTNTELNIELAVTPAFSKIDKIVINGIAYIKQPVVDIDNMTLSDAINCYCHECGANDEYAISYAMTHDNKPDELYKEACELAENEQLTFISILFGSEYNIFCPWFKSFLIYCMNEAKGHTTQRIAKGCYNLYKDLFNKIKDLNNE